MLPTFLVYSTRFAIAPTEWADKEKSHQIIVPDLMVNPVRRGHRCHYAGAAVLRAISDSTAKRQNFDSLTK